MIVDHGLSPLPVLPRVLASMHPWTAEKEEMMRARIVAEAKSWIGTPYIQQGDIKGAGVDCSMLLVRCWVDCRVTARFDPRPYPPNWHMHHSTERYLDWMNTLALEVETPKPGDVALFMVGRCFSHGGIMANSTQLISASAAHRGVVALELNDPWLFYDKHGGLLRERPRKFFDVFAKLREGLA